MAHSSILQTSGGGDFAVCRSDGVHAYQFVVVLDDIAMEVNQVLRGRDILHCTPRQVLLYQVFNSPLPEYVHIPLILDAQGERLAKRHGHMTLRSLREKGIRPGAIVGYLAWKAGLLSQLRCCAPWELVDGFSLVALPTRDICLKDYIIETLFAASFLL